MISFLERERKDRSQYDELLATDEFSYETVSKSTFDAFFLRTKKKTS